MASQTQDIIQVINTANSTENASVTVENSSRHWQELIAATEIAAAQYKEDNAQDTEVSKINGSTFTERTDKEPNSLPIDIDFTQQVQNGQTSERREKKSNDENMDVVKDNGQDPGKNFVEKRPVRRRKQTPIKESIIPKIQVSGSATEASATINISKKRKAEPYASAVTIRAKEKVEVSESASTLTRKKQGRNNKTKTRNNVIEDLRPSSSNNQKRHKLTADIVASSSDSSATTSEPSLSQSDEQEAEVAANPSNEGTTIRQRRQTADKSIAAPIERPRRSVRPVVPYGSEVAEQKVRNKKPIEILQGSGLPLSQIPHVLRAIDKMKTSDDVLKGLHKLIYGRMGTKHDIKNHIRAFSGFKIQTPLDEIVLKEKLEKWKIAGLKDMCHLFGLKSSGDKQKVVDRVYDFLKNPRDMTAPNEENGKGKGGKKKKSAAVKAKTIIIRRKTARDIFNAEQRPVYKEKAENNSKTRVEIDGLLAEAWKGLTEDDKKLYSEKANRSEPQQKRQNLKAKQPEIVEDSDLSEEEFEEQKEGQLKDAGIVDSNSDLSDPPSDDENNEDAIAEEDNAMEVDLNKTMPESAQSSRKRGAAELEDKEQKEPQKRQLLVASVLEKRQ